MPWRSAIHPASFPAIHSSMRFSLRQQWSLRPKPYTTRLIPRAVGYPCWPLEPLYTLRAIRTCSGWHTNIIAYDNIVDIYLNTIHCIRGSSALPSFEIRVQKVLKSRETLLFKYLSWNVSLSDYNSNFANRKFFKNHVRAARDARLLQHRRDSILIASCTLFHRWCILLIDARKIHVSGVE